MSKPMDRSNRFIAPPTAFEKAFPALIDACIESFETGCGLPMRAFSAAYELRVKLRSGGLISCSNPLCYRGGFEVDLDIHTTLARKLVTAEFMRACPGDEGSPEGRREGRRCVNILHYRITLEYRPEFAPARVKLKDRLAVVDFPECPSCHHPLVEEQDQGEPRVSCGRHVFAPLADGKLQLLAKTSSHWWPKIGEVVEPAKKASVDCLKMSEDVAIALCSGNAPVASIETARLCAIDNVPIFAETTEGIRQVVMEGERFRLRVVRGRDLVACTPGE